jgi:hypothetical protein
MGRRQIPLHRCISLVGWLVLLSLVITWIIAVAARNAMRLCFMVPILVLLAIFGVRFFLVCFDFICLIDLAMMYGFECYLNRHFERSQFCFIMPCAPQPIPEEDQKAALFAGLFLFVMQKLRNQYQDCVAFGNHVEERLR